MLQCAALDRNVLFVYFANLGANIVRQKSAGCKGTIMDSNYSIIGGNEFNVDGIRTHTHKVTSCIRMIMADAPIDHRPL